MIPLQQWWDGQDWLDKPWLLVGKGPTGRAPSDAERTRMHVLAINHTIREMGARVCSAVDVDVVAQCAQAIEQRADYLLMPRHPHVKNQPTMRRLEDFFDELPVLRRLSEAGRLVWYNLGSSALTYGNQPVVRSGTFSAEVVFRILAMQGVREIRTLGIDGGSQYNDRFADLSDRTRLANQQASFDTQFRGMGLDAHRFGVDFGPVGAATPVKVFVGTDESQLLGARVLEYSIRRHASLSVEVDYMMHVRAPEPREAKNQARTNFSFNRFAIPALCGYAGRAIYVDADMQVFQDIRELWEMPMDGAHLLYAEPTSAQRPAQFSVLLMDCQALDWDLDQIVAGLDEGAYDYAKLMQQLVIVPPEKIRQGLPHTWNSLERFEPGQTRLIHYTDMLTQPWVSGANANAHLWVAYLRDAIEDGFIDRQEVIQAIEAGYARPSLLDALSWPKLRSAVGLTPNYRLPRLWAKVRDLRFSPHAPLTRRLGGS